MSDSAREPKIHGILVTFQRPDDLRRSLDALENQTRPLDALVVIDNSPGREAEGVVAGGEPAARVDYLAPGENLGPAGGIAIGMTHCLGIAADEDWICLLDDDDPLPDAQVLADRLRLVTLRLPPDVAAIGDGGGVLDRRRGRLRPSEPGGAVDYLGSGYCPFYRVAAVRSVGVFTPELFFGFDDLEYGLRMTAAGWRLQVVPRPRAWDHPVRSPSLTVGPLDWRRYYSLRNIVYILRRNGYWAAAIRVSLVTGIAKPVVNLVIRPRLAADHLRMNARAVRDGWRGHLGLTQAPGSARRAGKPG